MTTSKTGNVSYLAAGLVPGSTGIATILTGGNIDLELFSGLGATADGSRPSSVQPSLPA